MKPERAHSARRLGSMSTKGENKESSYRTRNKKSEGEQAQAGDMGVELTARIVRGGQLLYALCNPVASFLPSRQPHNASQTRMASTFIKTSAAPRLASSLSGVAETVTMPYEQASTTSSRAERVRARASLDVGDCRAWALAPLTIESVNNVNRSGLLTALEASLGNEQVIITTITSIEPVYMRRLLSVSSPRSTCPTGRLPSAPHGYVSSPRSQRNRHERSLRTRATSGHPLSCVPPRDQLSGACGADWPPHDLRDHDGWRCVLLHRITSSIHVALASRAAHGIGSVKPSNVESQRRTWHHHWQVSVDTHDERRLWWEDEFEPTPSVRQSSNCTGARVLWPRERIVRIW